MKRLIPLLAFAASAAWADFGEYEGHALDGNTLTVSTSRGELHLTAVDDAAFEVHYVEAGVKQLPSFALAPRTREFAVATAETGKTLAVMIDGLTAIVDKSPVRVSYFRDGEPLVEEEHGYFAHETVRGFRFALEDGEKILGGGQRVLGMDRRGHRLPLYNKAHYGYTTESDQMYYSLPAIMSSDKYMIVFDNSASGWLDIGHTEPDVLGFEAVAGRTSYIVVAGDTYPALIGNYTDVTGKQPLPPRWAFGNFASRFGYRSERQTRDVVRRFRQQQIPLDAVILDIYWFGPDIQGHMGNLDWDRNAWPTPEDMIADFAADGVRTIAITEPFVLTTSKRWDDAVANDVLARTPTGEPRRFDFYFGNTGLVDVFDEKSADWFWQAYERLFEQGMAATWGDLGEPEVHPGDALHRLDGIEVTGDEIHNAYGHEWARIVYERQVEKYPGMRSLIMMRSGFAGSQRYGFVPWTGDVSRSWGGLKPQVELSLQGGLFGLAYMHSDLGGFAGGEAFDKELYIRWLQYGVFQPVYRPHAQEHIPAEPVFHDRETRDIVRDFIDLRYRLLPYNYTLAWENSTTGMPLMRPAMFEEESIPWLIDFTDGYFWGDAFYVAPVTDPGVETRRTMLPPGAWFDFWTGERYENGGRYVDIPVTLETIPVLVRAGSFVPMTPGIQTTRDYSSRELTLHYYADESVRHASGRMYEDDGRSRTSIDDGAFELLEFNATHRGNALQVGLSKTGDGYEGMPGRRDITLVVHNWTADAGTVTVDGREIPVTRRMPRSGAGAAVDGDKLTVRFDWRRDTATVRVNEMAPAGKPVVYQVWTRLFGNKTTTNEPWGTIEENGVGKFRDFTNEALRGIRELGVSHIWFTGVPHHAVVRDYTAYGISNDDPDVVKGRAGSPYAVKDYYNVNPDLAVDPAKRLEEFDALIERTHAAGMKVVIDIVPNHVARRYESISRPDGVEDFGAGDDTSVEWARDNNFYYIVGEDFELPDFPEHYEPLGGEDHPLADGHFEESPAKWTGNGASVAKPDFMDWFETVKINHGVRPDGSYAFDRLPDGARGWSNEEHVAFWADKDVPDSWIKYRQITEYWLARGVDGFRYDMAEMVPVEFWSYLNTNILAIDPDAFLLAEVYDPDLYRDYLQLGRMGYLYDKVGLYDALKPVMRGEASTDTLAPVHEKVLDIEEHMLHFLENHDEERIASADFVGDGHRGKPGMVVSALIGRSPTMLYFAQDVGEAGDANDANFNRPPKQRTTQYDYWGVPAHQRWMNGGRFDGGALSERERSLRDFYKRLMSFSATSPALQGEYAHIPVDNDRVFAFARWTDEEQLIVVSNFDAENAQELVIEVPGDIVAGMGLGAGRRALEDRLYGGAANAIVVDHGTGKTHVRIDPLESFVYRVGGGMFKAPDNAPFMADLAGSGALGTQVYWHDVESAFLDEKRNVVVWLPPGYDDDPGKRYKVIYMTDGENLFDPRIASWGVDWGVDEAMMRGAADGRFEPAIVVGNWSTMQRGLEYSPWHEGPEYARYLIEELMPRVDKAFRTKKGPANTFAMGSSMGGLTSYMLVKEHHDVFGACGCVSSHFALSERNYAEMSGGDGAEVDPRPYVVRDIESGASVSGGRFFFDYGTETLDSTYEQDHEPVRAWLLEQGLVEGRDFRMEKDEGADHSERAWRARLGKQLEWLLGD
ncbi:MAG: alpha-amylase family glycosyl hydrolase [Proteobacteria bacterium]|nr:alpha-amylase family glycosyl hydrolase [Pseudomonadota bacterium]